MGTHYTIAISLSPLIALPYPKRAPLPPGTAVENCFYVSASLFLLSAVKAPEKAQTMVFKELQHEDTNQRINAVLRYFTSFNKQCRPRSNAAECGV